MSPYSAELRHAVCQQVGRQAVALPAEPPWKKCWEDCTTPN